MVDVTSPLVHVRHDKQRVGNCTTNTPLQHWFCHFYKVYGKSATSSVSWSLKLESIHLFSTGIVHCLLMTQLFAYLVNSYGYHIGLVRLCLHFAKQSICDIFWWEEGLSLIHI